VASVNGFNCLEMELMQLLKFKKNPPYPVSYALKRDDPILLNAEEKILDCLN
jgi:hypothetical protein